MSVAVIDAGVAIAWIQGRHRSQARLERLFRSGRDGRIDVVISVVNLAEVDPCGPSSALTESGPRRPVNQRPVPDHHLISMDADGRVVLFPRHDLR